MATLILIALPMTLKETKPMLSILGVIITTSMFVCESKMRFYKVPYGVRNMYCVDFAENALFSSFGIIADAKLLDF